MSRILIWSPNYAPELTGIPPLVTDAAEWLGGHGHGIEIVTAVPNYPERVIRVDYRGALWRSERRGTVWCGARGCACGRRSGFVTRPSTS